MFALTSRVPPRRWNSRSCSTRRNFACAARLISVTSSRNNTPPDASSIWPGLAWSRAREGAALVSKQLGLEQLLGQRGAIQRDERPVPARRRGMDEPRDDFLAGARFAGNEHGGIRRGDLRRVAQHPAPFDRLADDAQVGARRRMVETSRHDGVDTLGTIVVEFVVRRCDSQHRHCPPCLRRFWSSTPAATTSVRVHSSAHKARSTKT